MDQQSKALNGLEMLRKLWQSGNADIHRLMRVFPALDPHIVDLARIATPYMEEKVTLESVFQLYALWLNSFKDDLVAECVALHSRVGKPVEAGYYQYASSLLSKLDNFVRVVSYKLPDTATMLETDRVKGIYALLHFSKFVEFELILISEKEETTIGQLLTERPDLFISIPLFDPDKQPR